MAATQALLGPFRSYVSWPAVPLRWLVLVSFRLKSWRVSDRSAESRKELLSSSSSYSCSLSLIMDDSSKTGSLEHVNIDIYISGTPWCLG